VRIASFYGLMESTSEDAPISAPMTLSSWLSAAHGDASGFWLQSLLADFAFPTQFVWGQMAAAGRVDARAAELIDAEQRCRAELGDVGQYRHADRIGEAAIHREIGDRFGKDHVGAGVDVGAGAVDRLIAVPHLLDRAVDVQVVRLDVRDDRDLWVVVEEGAVVLVRFDDEVGALAGHGVRRQVAHLAADHEGRGEASAPEHEGDE